ncbi:MAG: DUF4142 domain-containing protein [Verrucomicrobium sp.]|nr:DUF4142 domain-containing protein [Verrucomicrobium sp.]
MNKLNLLHAAIVSASLFLGAGAALAVTPLSPADQAFLKNAYQTGLFEIKSGTYAGDNAENSSVRDLGKDIASDHTSLNKKLADFAQDHGYALPTDLTSTTVKKVSAFSALSGTALDKAYLKSVSGKHEEAILAYKKESATTSNADLRELINGALPTLKDHAEKAELLNTKLAAR